MTDDSKTLKIKPAPAQAGPDSKPGPDKATEAVSAIPEGAYQGTGSIGTHLIPITNKFGKDDTLTVVTN